MIRTKTAPSDPEDVCRDHGLEARGRGAEEEVLGPHDERGPQGETPLAEPQPEWKAHDDRDRHGEPDIGTVFLVSTTTLHTPVRPSAARPRLVWRRSNPLRLTREASRAVEWGCQCRSAHFINHRLLMRQERRRSGAAAGEDERPSGLPPVRRARGRDGHDPGVRKRNLAGEMQQADHRLGAGRHAGVAARVRVEADRPPGVEEPGTRRGRRMAEDDPVDAGPLEAGERAPTPTPRGTSRRGSRGAPRWPVRGRWGRTTAAGRRARTGRRASGSPGGVRPSTRTGRPIAIPSRAGRPRDPPPRLAGSRTTSASRRRHSAARRRGTRADRPATGAAGARGCRAQGAPARPPVWPPRARGAAGRPSPGCRGRDRCSRRSR